MFFYVGQKLMQLIGPLVVIAINVCMFATLHASQNKDELTLLFGFDVLYLIVACVHLEARAAHRQSERADGEPSTHQKQLGGHIVRVQPIINRNPCPVCLEEHGDFVFRTTCNHHFHPQCVTHCLDRNHSQCPLCRTEMLTDCV